VSGSGSKPPSFLTSALHGGKWSASRPGRFTPGEGDSVTHWIGGWVGPRASLDTGVEKNLLLLPGIESRPSSPWPVAVLTELSGLLGPTLQLIIVMAPECTCIRSGQSVTWQTSVRTAKMRFFTEQNSFLIAFQPLSSLGQMQFCLGKSKHRLPALTARSDGWNLRSLAVVATAVGLWEDFGLYALHRLCIYSRRFRGSLSQWIPFPRTRKRTKLTPKICEQATPNLRPTSKLVRGELS
jgi:hypothetical protein